MSFHKSWHLAFVALCRWGNRQQDVVEFQNAQIEALLQKLGEKQVMLTENQRRVLGVKGRVLGRQESAELSTIAPDTILRRNRALVAKKWDGTDTVRTALILLLIP